MFRKAERKKARLRLGLVGPSGSGKTYSALLIAKGLGGRIAIVDTENRSADLYAHLTDYDVAEMQPPYEVEKYIRFIDEAEKEGYNVLILDSISHAWAGEGGLLDRQGKIADSGKGNSYTAWRSVTPLHNKFIEKILNSNLHIIATMRAKTEYTIQQNEKGKQEVKKIGMAPVQREGMDYEFTVVLDLDVHHNATASKDRTSMFDGKIFTPNESTGETLLEWLESGVDPSERQEQKQTPGKPEVKAEPPRQSQQAASGREMASTAQIQKIQILCKEGGLNTRELILMELSEFCGRKIESSKDLTKAEASSWIEKHTKEAA